MLARRQYSKTQSKMAECEIQMKFQLCVGKHMSMYVLLLLISMRVCGRHLYTYMCRHISYGSLTITDSIVVENEPFVTLLDPTNCRI